MTTPATITITSAYRQLRAVEKVFVDRFISDMQSRADRRQVRLSTVLNEPVVPDKDGFLTRATVLAAITERVMELHIADELSHERIVREYCAIAFSNVMDVVELDGYGNPQFNLLAATPEQQRAIKKITYEQSATGATRLNIEMHDKMRALDWASNYTGLSNPENLHWRSSNAQPVLDSTASTRDAADAYSRMLSQDGE